MISNPFLRLGMEGCEGISDALKTEAKLKIITAAMKIFRPASYEEYEQVVGTFVNHLARQLQERFNIEGDNLKLRYSRISEAFTSVANNYVTVVEQLDTVLPLEKQVEFMFRKLGESKTLIDINGVVVEKLQREKSMGRSGNTRLHDI